MLNQDVVGVPKLHRWKLRNATVSSNLSRPCVGCRKGRQYKDPKPHQHFDEPHLYARKLGSILLMVPILVDSWSISPGFDADKAR